MMNVHNVRDLSLGQWTAIVRGWNRAHSDKVDPPSVEEFEAAMEGRWLN
jgi:hypothetical protein